MRLQKTGYLHTQKAMRKHWRSNAPQKKKQEYAQQERDNKIHEVIGEEHLKITGRIFDIDDDVVVKTDRLFETYDEHTCWYYNYVEASTGLWRNSIWEHYQTGINRIRKIRAEKNLEEYKARKDYNYAERKRNNKLYWKTWNI